MQSLLEEAVKGSLADYLEIRWEETKRTKVHYVGKELEDIGENINTGGCVRAQVRGGWGFVSFNKLDKINKYVQIAIKEANLVGKEESLLAEVEVIKDKVRLNLKKDPRRVSLKEKQRLMERYNKIILSYPKIQSSNIRYRDIWTKKYFVNSLGANIFQEKVDVGLGFTAIAREGGNVQQANFGLGGVDGYQIVEGLEDKVEEITKVALDSLSAQPIRAGRWTVIADPELSGLFAHEAFGHMSEGDFLYENKEMQDLMKLGKRFGKDHLNIIDDGGLPSLQGTQAYDDEGVPTQRTYLIKDGILSSRLHSRETAYKMKEKITGNARAISYRYSPIVRMTNTFIDKGEFSFEEMLEGIEEGIYAKGSRGGQTNCELFTFGAREAFLIEKGKITKRLRDVVLSGNIFETLENIEMIGDRVVFFGGVGGCGKAGQSPLPISLGGPQIRIRDVMVGGK